MTDTKAQKSVLIVDDIEDNRVLLERALKSGGYLTTSVESGQAALAHLTQHLPDIVLLDWMMPGLSGFETLVAIREQHSAWRLPVIMCTAVGEDENIVDAIEAGANDYIVKPISLPVLRARMNAHLAQSETVNGFNAERDQAKERLVRHTRHLLRRQAEA